MCMATHPTPRSAATGHRRGADVVDEVGSGGDRGPCRPGVPGVDGDADAAPPAPLGDGLDDGNDPALLLGLGDRIGTGPGRLTAHVDDRGALVDHLVGAGDGVGDREVTTTIGERVGRDVQDAHDDGNGCRQRVSGRAR